MVALSVQSVLLMVAAYFIGAVLACVIRRSLSAAARATVTAGERRVDPLPEVALRDAQRGRFAGGAEAPRPAHRPVPSAAVRPPAPVVAPQGQGQDLKSIQGIDAGTEAQLGGLGVTRYEQIAAWLRADVERIDKALGQKGRVARE